MSGFHTYNLVRRSVLFQMCVIIIQLHHDDSFGVRFLTASDVIVHSITLQHSRFLSCISGFEVQIHGA